ncbi:hypothetical protein Hesp01_19850 [Herbidospora sp. NBRC 101105]|nr:helix-turn-helix domain-containing protein [Herbidospora sp. NBRC 101105]GLX94035.1 hypothetical protein Hesp01_19850 [Herbidospora sp. NBRC 101105]
MAEPVRARRLSDHEGQTLQRLIRRGAHGSIRVRRALIIMASAGGTPVGAVARLVAADEDTVRDVIHAFDERGLSALDPNWAGGRPATSPAMMRTSSSRRPPPAGVAGSAHHGWLHACGLMLDGDGAEEG